jgi:DNA-binding XRE family transcriptional regulator
MTATAPVSRPLIFDGCRLQREREKLGWNRTQLAAPVGVSAESVKNWEIGRHDPSASAAAALALHLGLEISDLFRPNQSDPGATVATLPRRRLVRLRTP